MRVLVACEFSQVVCKAFRERGHEAYSCDILPTDGNPEWHIQDDVLKHLQGGWDFMIAHPPCKYISNMSNCRINEPGRAALRKAGLLFFLKFTTTGISRVAIENPRGLPERAYRSADQIIQPYHFGEPYSKATCLWLFNLPPLVPTSIVKPDRKWDGKRYRTFVDRLPSSSPKRSITFQNIANAMATQWGSPAFPPPSEATKP